MPVITILITISIGIQPPVRTLFSFVSKVSVILETFADNSLHISISLIPKLFVLRALVRLLHLKDRESFRMLFLLLSDTAFYYIVYILLCDQYDIFSGIFYSYKYHLFA